jgi:prevent-host-death family protein
MNTMTITASKLRENIYRILDEVAETGIPVEVVRKGVVLRIILEKKISKLARLKRRKAFVGDPDDLLKIDWSGTEGYKNWIEKWNAQK